MQSDQELLEIWRSGDREAGQRLLRRHFDSLYRFFHNKLGEGVDDLIQRTFLACVEGRDRVREDASLKAYILGIARNQLLMFLRRKQRRETPIEDVTIAEVCGSPSRIMAEREEEKLLLQALRQIPVELQMAVELYYWERLSVNQIAEIVEIPAGTVKSRLFRARDAIRQALEAMAIPRELLQTTVGGFERWAQSLRDQLARDDVPKDRPS